MIIFISAVFIFIAKIDSYNKGYKDCQSISDSIIHKQQQIIDTLRYTNERLYNICIELQTKIK